MRINIHLTCVTFIACTKNTYNLVSYKLVFIINTFYAAAGKFDRQLRPSGLNIATDVYR